MDLFFRGDSLTTEKNRFHLAIGGKYTANEFYESVGGGGANVAVGAAAAGLKTAVCGRIGENPFKQIIIQKLTSRHVSRDLLIFNPDYINISTILLANTGDKTVVHYCNRKPAFILTEAHIKALSMTRALYLGNIPDMDLGEKTAVAQSLKKKGILLAINIGVDDCRKGLKKVAPYLSLADILLLNAHEFSDLVGKPYEKIEFKKNCLDIYKIQSQCLVITNGKLGSACYTKKDIYFQPAIEKEVLDTTGAGDAFTSGFLSEYIRSRNPIQSLLSGAKYACKIISKVGAQ